MNVRIVPANGLEKIFLDQAPSGTFTGGSLLSNEGYSFQFAFMGILDTDSPWGNWSDAQVQLESDINEHLDLYLVENVAAALPTYTAFDHGYLRTSPGLFPDILKPIPHGKIKVLNNKWQSIWVRTHGELPPGNHKISCRIIAKNHQSEPATVMLKVLPLQLPSQKLKYTNWFHCDCIATLHNCKIFSQAHWALMDQYMKLAGENGMNMILVPAFTPPLDTAIGAERDTVQLVGVHKEKERYIFDFEKLDRFIKMATANGINWFEHSHFFTQWGAKSAPKVVAEIEGETKQIFGWDTVADGPEYTQFLHQYLDALIPHLKTLGVDQRFYYHISDEPIEEHVDTYRRAKEVVISRLKDYSFFEALSHISFYENGLVPIPVAVTSTIHDFVGKVDELWTYYTGAQSFSYANRLISMASRRNRILGMQMYKDHIKGFLHWAFNFYYTTLSREVCNPMVSPDAFAEFPAGTAYQVYPASQGPIPSLRLFVFQDGLQDMRAMELLEEKIGHDQVIALLEKVGGIIGWKECPASDEQFLKIRETLNDALAKEYHV